MFSFLIYLIISIFNSKYNATDSQIYNLFYATDSQINNCHLNLNYRHRLKFTILFMPQIHRLLITTLFYFSPTI